MRAAFSPLPSLFFQPSSYGTDQEIKVFMQALTRDRSEPSSPRLSGAASEQIRLEIREVGRSVFDGIKSPASSSPIALPIALFLSQHQLKSPLSPSLTWGLLK